MAEDSGGRAKGEEEMEMVDFPWDFRFIGILESNTFTVMTCDDFVLVVQKQHLNAQKIKLTKYAVLLWGAFTCRMKLSFFSFEVSFASTL